MRLQYCTPVVGIMTVDAVGLLLVTAWADRHTHMVVVFTGGALGAGSGWQSVS